VSRRIRARAQGFTKESGQPFWPRLRDSRIAEWVIAPLVVAVLGGVAVWYLTRDRGPTTTDVSLARLYDGNRLISGLKVTARVAGDCSRGAEGSGNPEALRCLDDHEFVRDPCYPSANERQVACPERPWGSRVVILRPKTPIDGAVATLDREGDVPPPPAAGLELADGQRCFYIEGAGQKSVGGLRVNYECEHGYTVGRPRRFVDRLWTAAYASRGASATRTVKVVHVWF
jgi:hypothetical protein